MKTKKNPDWFKRSFFFISTQKNAPLIFFFPSFMFSTLTFEIVFYGQRKHTWIYNKCPLLRSVSFVCFSDVTDVLFSFLTQVVFMAYGDAPWFIFSTRNLILMFCPQLCKWIYLTINWLNYIYRWHLSWSIIYNASKLTIIFTL